MDETTKLNDLGSNAGLGAEPMPPDCRTCLHFGWKKLQCFSVAACVAGNLHRASRPIYLWSRIDGA